MNMFNYKYFVAKDFIYVIQSLYELKFIEMILQIKSILNLLLQIKIEYL